MKELSFDSCKKKSKHRDFFEIKTQKQIQIRARKDEDEEEEGVRCKIYIQFDIKQALQILLWNCIHLP